MTFCVYRVYNSRMIDTAKILAELETEREVRQHASSKHKPPGSGGPPPNQGGQPPNAGGAAQLAGIGNTRSGRETRREPS
jgi:hypothetical protein